MGRRPRRSSSARSGESVGAPGLRADAVMNDEESVGFHGRGSTHQNDSRGPVLQSENLGLSLIRLLNIAYCTKALVAAPKNSRRYSILSIRPVAQNPQS